MLRHYTREMRSGRTLSLSLREVEAVYGLKPSGGSTGRSWRLTMGGGSPPNRNTSSRRRACRALAAMLESRPIARPACEREGADKCLGCQGGTLSWLAQPLGPSFILVGGTIVLLLLRWLPWPQASAWGAALATLAGMAALIALRSPSAAILAGRPWSSLLYDVEGGIAWQINAWTWASGALILLFLFVVILLGWERRERLAGYYRVIDLALAAAALAVTFSANLLTLASMWVLMESVALARLTIEPTYELETGRMGLSAASVLLMALACALSGPALLTIPFAAASLPPLTQALLTAAIALRAAAYPLHGWLTHSRLAISADRFAVYLIPATTGLWLLGQINSTAGMAWIGEPQWLVLIIFSLFGSAVTAWADVDPGRSLDLVYANRAGAILLALSLWPGQGALPLAGALLSFSLGLALFLVAGLAHQMWGAQWPRLLAVLTLLGFPLTAGFIGQVWFARLAPPAGFLPLWMVTVLADSLLLATLLKDWRRAPGHPAQGMPGQAGRVLTAAVLIAIPLAFIGLQPTTALRLIGVAVPPAGLLSLALSMPAVVWARLLIVPALALWFVFEQQRISAQWRHLQAGLVRLARLDWIYSLTQTAILTVQLLWQSLLRIVEGEGYMGWVMLTLLLIWLLFRP